MDYRLMSDEDIIRDLAEKIEKKRIEHQLKETDIGEAAGISRKTLYNFRQGSQGTSLKTFIRLLRAIDEIHRLQWMFPESETYSPRNIPKPDLPKRVRDKQKPKDTFVWGDEK